MNKGEFIKRLQEETGYNEDRCTIVNEVIENNFIFSKKNKQKVIDSLMLKSFTEDEAENIYDIAMRIIASEIKDRVKHPFRSRD